MRFGLLAMLAATIGPSNHYSVEEVKKGTNLPGDIRWRFTAESSGINPRSQKAARKHWRRNPSQRPR